MLFPSLTPTILEAVSQFGSIPEPRKKLLKAIAEYVAKCLQAGQKAELVYICTHNSRRSHFGQIWGQTAAAYYSIDNVFSYSGGTEATAFHPNAIKAVQSAGFSINKEKEEPNPTYRVLFGMNEATVVCFSKKYDDPINPKEGFCAIIMCTEANGACPYVQGAVARIAAPYDDPKDFDNTPLQEAKYEERCMQIASETLYAFSMIKQLIYS